MFPMEMETTVPCAPMGTAAIRMATKIASKRKNRSLNAFCEGCVVEMESDRANVSVNMFKD